MVRKNQSILPGAIAANGIQLSVVTDLLFRQRMHRPIGQTCSAIALYQYANEGHEVETSFVIIPGVGGAGYATWSYGNITKHEVGCVVFDGTSDRRMGQKLMNELVRLFGDQIPRKGVKSQEPTTFMLAKARAKYRGSK